MPRIQLVYTRELLNVTLVCLGVLLALLGLSSVCNLCDSDRIGCEDAPLDLMLRTRLEDALSCIFYARLEEFLSS